METRIVEPIELTYAIGTIAGTKGAGSATKDVGILMLSPDITDVIEPDFYKRAANNRTEKYSDTFKQIIDNPIFVVENIVQSISDRVEEGLAYVTENMGASFVPLVGWSKYVNFNFKRNDKHDFEEFARKFCCNNC